ncbi:alpha/beta fold hydrolase [Actinophytocola gossypii]|uniref:Alpha/beta fold hydrolase n=1 Tax=Actinophytocola gossypii TaxID=2812003 RepID=A0ABT2JCJ4_9PSEU|nr:alpha/beta fold hydrolase [Actinophytocola gossypii]MCT2585496.1 alpha/beta fold hydrolase [Actinophytocola gossypii]
MPGPVGRAVPVTGGELWVHVWGEPDAEPVLAVHGITASGMAWNAVADRLSTPMVAPDLRGRGRSVAAGPYGMAGHAEDCVRVLDALGIERARVVGHSMGGFVAAVFAHRHPDRVARLVLVDGGAPLAAPDGDPDALLGPAAERLRMTFPSRDAYRDFWRAHPAFRDWSPAVEAYVDHDLGPDGRSRVAEEAMRADFVDLHHGAAGRDAFAALPEGTPFLRAERGLLDEVPPLYPDPPPGLDVRSVPDSNHYSILFAHAGVVAAALD